MDLATSFKLALLEDVIVLRHRILRKGRPVETAFFVEDCFESTKHFCLFAQDEKLICCLTITPNLYNELDACFFKQLFI